MKNCFPPPPKIVLLYKWLLIYISYTLIPSTKPNLKNLRACKGTIYISS